ncbi:hypothetical protein V5799_023453 [Amblyomma americanum]|uniref:Asparaginase n=1 Tax=Amblyomma americanum TaxID=6943 RepID=A0AAQ4FHT0_AMBAM
MEAVVAVHVGAGFHAPEKLADYRRLCAAACRRAVGLLERSDGSALEAAAGAVAVLEDDPLTNAGFGSNLTSCGRVECDASVMDGRTLGFGAVGAVPRVANPVLVAEALCRTQQAGPLPLGLTPPCFLVGEGALHWARDHVRADVEREPRALVSSRARRRYAKLRRRLERCAQDPLDTVGAVCMDRRGDVAAAVSSGGIWLKHSGRVGQAAVYGCGCWAENAAAGGCAVAVSSSGSGEQLIRSALVRQCAQALRRPEDDKPVVALDDCFQQGFLRSPFLNGVAERQAGVLALRWDPQCSTGDVLWAHTTHSMCYGYMLTGGSGPKFGCSQMPDSASAGSKVVLGGVPLGAPRVDDEEL